MNEEDPTWVLTYLEMLKVDRQKPSAGYLTKICRSHLQTFPFENISKLLHASNPNLIASPTQFLRSTKTYGTGGTCFNLNANLYRLLSELGFRSYPVLLSGKHLAIIVEDPDSPGESLYVDCGSGAPIFKPLYFQSDPQNAARFGFDCVSIVAVDEEELSYRYSRFTNGTLTSSDWVFRMGHACSLEDIEQTVEKSLQPGTTFMSMLRCQLYQLNQNRNLSLANNKFTIQRVDGEKELYILNSSEEIERVLRHEFGLPNMPVAKAVEELLKRGIDIFTVDK